MSFRTSVRLLLALSAIPLLPSCALFKPVKGVPTQHIVMVESNGRLMDPTGSAFCHPDRIDDDNKEWLAKQEQEERKTVAPPTKDARSWTPCNGRFNNLWLRELDHADPKNPKEVIPDADRYLNDLFKQMDAFHATRGPNEPRKVVIFIHGGLNNNISTIKRARDTAAVMREDGVYPIFLNWQSNLVGALWEHLMNVRQGDHKGYRHFYPFPFYLAADLAKGFARAPATWFYQGSSNYDRARHVVKDTLWPFDETYCRLRTAYMKCAGDENCKEIAISKGPETHGKLERGKAFARFAATGLVPTRYWAMIGGGWANPVGWLPPKLIASPILDGLGGPAWDTMLRHAAVPFHSDGVANPDKAVMEKMEGLHPPEGNGGFSRFFRLLREKMTDCKPAGKDQCPEWEITIIGHSMGAIVLNHLLNEFPTLPVDHIVYLASAASVRDYERAVYPYLERHQNTRMHHLTLHNFAEIRDQYFKEIPPAGSLLVWIDSFLSKPETFRDRTAGTFANLMRFADETPVELRSRISIKTFGIGEDILESDPQHHGDFGFFDGTKRKGKFWDPNFWAVEPTERQRAVACPTDVKGDSR